MKKKILSAVFGIAFMAGGLIVMESADALAMAGPNCPDGATLCAFDADNNTWHKGNKTKELAAF